MSILDDILNNKKKQTTVQTVKNAFSGVQMGGSSPAPMVSNPTPTGNKSILSSVLNNNYTAPKSIQSPTYNTNNLSKDFNASKSNILESIPFKPFILPQAILNDTSTPAMVTPDKSGVTKNPIVNAITGGSTLSKFASDTMAGIPKAATNFSNSFNKNLIQKPADALANTNYMKDVGVGLNEQNGTSVSSNFAQEFLKKFSVPLDSISGLTGGLYKTPRQMEQDTANVQAKKSSDAINANEGKYLDTESKVLDTKNTEINDLSNNLNSLKNQIDISAKNLDKTSQISIDSYNNSINSFNSQQKVLEEKINDYNSSIGDYKTRYDQYNTTLAQAKNDYNKAQSLQGDAVDKGLSAISYGIGAAVSMGLGGELLVGENATAQFSLLLKKVPIIGKYVSSFAEPLLKNAAGFAAYSQLDPNLVDNLKERVTKIGEAIVMAPLYTSLGVIKNAGIAIPASFSLGYGMARLSGASQEDSLKAGFTLGMLELFGRGSADSLKTKPNTNLQKFTEKSVTEDLKIKALSVLNKYSDTYLTRDSSPKEFQQAYRKGALQNHPDKTGSTDHSEYNAVSDAYSLLTKDPTVKVKTPNPEENAKPTDEPIVSQPSKTQLQISEGKTQHKSILEGILKGNVDNTKEVFASSGKNPTRATREGNSTVDPLQYDTVDDFIKAQGTPIYHGTNQDFKSFSNVSRGNSTKMGSAKRGTFFTDSQTEAKSYGDFADNNLVANKKAFEKEIKRLTKLQAEAERKAQMTRNPSDWEKSEDLTQQIEDFYIDETRDNVVKNAKVIEAYADIKNPMVYDFAGAGAKDSTSGGISELIKQAKKDGHDGLIMKNILDDPGKSGVPTTHTVVFDSKNIKTRQQLTDIYNKAKTIAPKADTRAKDAIAKGMTEDDFVKSQQLTQTLRGTKGLTSDQIQKQYPNIRLTKEVAAKDVYGNAVKIPDGEKLTPYEMKDGKIVLQDGQAYVVSKNQFANIKGNTVGGEAKPFEDNTTQLRAEYQAAMKDEPVTAFKKFPNMSDLVDKPTKESLVSMGKDGGITADDLNTSIKVSPKQIDKLLKGLVDPRKIDFESISRRMRNKKNMVGFYKDPTLTRLKPVIGLYQSVITGRIPVGILFHEINHYLESQIYSKKFVQKLHEMTLQVMTKKDISLYEKAGYDTIQKITAEYRSDKFGNEELQKAFLDGRLKESKMKRLFDLMKSGYNKIVLAVKKFNEYIKSIPNKQGGFVNFFAKEESNLSSKLQKMKDDLEQSQVMIEIRKDYLANSPMRKLAKYESSAYRGELPEVTGRKDKGIYNQKGDKIAQEVMPYQDNIKDDFIPEEINTKYQEYAKARQELVEMKRDYQKQRVEFMIAKSEVKEVKKVIAKTKPQNLDELNKRDSKSLDSFLNKQDKQTKDLIDRQAILKSAAKKEIQEFEGSTGMVRSLEITAQQILDKVDPKYSDKVDSLPDIITQQSTDIKNKVNILDYFRTPDIVLKKIGFYREAEMMRDAYEEYVKELPKNIDKISKWAKSVPKESNLRIFKFLDGEAIDLNTKELEVAGEIKVWLADWAKRLKLPEDNTITHYITHIFDDVLINKDFDEDLAKIITDKIPKQVYDPFLEKRLGAKGYKQNVWEALDAYVKRATRKVHMDPVLERISNKAGSELQYSPLEKSQYVYISKYIRGINMRPTDLDEIIDNLGKSIFGNRLGQRPITRVTKILRRLTYRAMLGLNPGSALRNLSQGINTYAVLGEKNTVIGYANLFKKGALEELKREGVLNSNFIEDRTLSSTKNIINNMDKGLFVSFEIAEKINRGAAYFGAKAKYWSDYSTVLNGERVFKPYASEERAIKYAKSVVRKTQFAFDAVDTPLILQSDIAKTVGQFQSFTTKQIEFLVGMMKDRNYIGLLRYAIASLVFALTVGDAFGMKPKDFIPSYRIGMPPSWKTAGAIIGAVLDLPDKYGNDRNITTKLEDIAKTFTGLIPAGTQFKKSYEGLESIRQGGSYDKAGRLQFKQGTNIASKLQSILFGKYASDSSQEYFDSKGDETSKYKSIMPIYEKAKELDQNGNVDELNNLIKSLPEEDWKLIKEYKSFLKSNITNEQKQEFFPIYKEIQEVLKTDVEKATSMVQELSQEDYKIYQSLKKNKTTDNKKERSFIADVVIYAKAIGTDPVTAFNLITKGEKIRKIENGTIIVDRMSMSSSQAVKKDRGGMNSSFKLDHTIPLELGGSNAESNLKLVPTEVHANYTATENYLGGELRAGRMTKKQVQEAIIKFKENSIK